MLALLAAATLAGSPPAVDRTLLGRAFEASRFASGFLRTPSHCGDAARIQTGFEPTLLYREQDKAAARLRRLIDLPPGELCLVATPLDARGEGR